MKRKLYDELLKWKASKNRKPLLLTGARQVGKTYLLKEFAKNEFEYVIYFNFDAEKERLESIFEGSIVPSDIISQLELLINTKITPDNTILIFDEIQELPRALTALKYFQEDAPEYYIAASGSLLGIALHPGTSFPVGKVDMLELLPLDFEEFLMATSNQHLLKAVDDRSLLSVVSDKFTTSFKEYLVVGGMPEAVADWASKHDLESIDKIQNAILLAYFNDISKHTDTTMATRIHQIWDSLPAQFAKRNEKFMFNVIREGARGREYETAVQWLVDCKIVRKIERVKVGNRLPLKAYADNSAFKLYFLDVGLFRHLAGVSTAFVMDDETLYKEFNGFFVEQFVLQQLQPKYEMYYWSSDANAEVDFVTTMGSNVVPIEVKSGTNVKAKSLKIFRDSYQPKLSIRFSMLPFEYNNGLLNLPIYLSGFVDALVAEFL